MKTKFLSVLLQVVLMSTLVVANSYADVTGDFTVLSGVYSGNPSEDGGDVIITGTVNHGAIQSKKTVAVEVTYDIAYTYTTTENQTVTVTIPGVCTDPEYYEYSMIKSGKVIFPNKVKCDNANKESSILWRGSSELETKTITQTFSSSNQMIAITEPTVVKGRLNPKGKITGYNWSSEKSLVPWAMANSLIPTGSVLVDAVITNISYKAFLRDVDGFLIVDTLFEEKIF